MKGIKIGQGGSKTPKTVMGSQGNPATIPESFSKPRSTSSTKAPHGTKSSKAVSGPFNHARGDN